MDITHHGAIPGNSLPPRDASPCALGGDCGPIVVDPTSTSISSAPAATCTEGGSAAIGFVCFESGPHAGQCITIACLDRPNTCGCPDAPPPAAARKEKRTADPAPTSTSTVTSPSPTCTDHHGPIPIGEECFTSGPLAGQCVSIACRESPNTCGCPGAPPPAARKDKRATSTAPPPSPTVCTEPKGAIPIGEECFTSGPHVGQCISFECLEHPNNCGCPGAPPPASTQEKRSEVIQRDVCLRHYLFHFQNQLTRL